MPWIDLVPLTDDERELFITEDLVDYAAQIERDEGLSSQDAMARAHDELSVALRDGHATAAERGERRFTALDRSGVSVGWLWVTPFPDHDGPAACLPVSDHGQTGDAGPWLWLGHAHGVGGDAGR